MKLQRSKEWWLNRARCEGDTAVSAGVLAIDPALREQESSSTISGTAIEGSLIAFGKFVNLMRRRRGYSMERLAEVADLDARDLLVIEDHHHVPEPRTVYKLAQAFELPQRRLMELAGLVTANDLGLRNEAVRFATRAQSVEKLSPEESAALEAFVAVLSKQDAISEK